MFKINDIYFAKSEKMWDHHSKWRFKRHQALQLLFIVMLDTLLSIH